MQKRVSKDLEGLTEELEQTIDLGPEASESQKVEDFPTSYQNDLIGTPKHVAAFEVRKRPSRID